MENPRAFKHQINPALLHRLAQNLRAAWPEFPSKDFVRLAAGGLENLELKARIDAAARAMAQCLPADYDRALPIVLGSLGPPLGENKAAASDGFYHWIHGRFVERFGRDHFDLSLAAMVEITRRSTAEFAIRPYLNLDLDRCLRFLESNLNHRDQHVRRWISEGARPNLPWGERVPRLRAEAERTLPLLEALHNDPSDYVRLSVANHMNDLSGLRPALAVETVRRWRLEKKPHSEALARRALRNRIKAGDEKALRALGFGSKAPLRVSRFGLEPKTVIEGKSLRFSVELRASAPLRLVLDYAIYFCNARGGHSRKVFKGKTAALKADEVLRFEKSHSFKPITTRRYFSGEHRVEILANGKKIAAAVFNLRAQKRNSAPAEKKSASAGGRARSAKKASPRRRKT